MTKRKTADEVFAESERRVRCPTPTKQAHAEEAKAVAQVERTKSGMHHYLCRCGSWHAGHASNLKGAR